MKDLSFFLRGCREVVMDYVNFMFVILRVCILLLFLWIVLLTLRTCSAHTPSIHTSFAFLHNSSLYFLHLCFLRPTEPLFELIPSGEKRIPLFLVTYEPVARKNYPLPGYFPNGSQEPQTMAILHIRRTKRAQSNRPSYKQLKKIQSIE